MPILKMYKCTDCKYEFKDLPKGAQLCEIVDINPATGALENKKPVPQECPDCGLSNIEPVLENGQHKNA